MASTVLYAVAAQASPQRVRTGVHSPTSMKAVVAEEAAKELAKKDAPLLAKRGTPGRPGGRRAAASPTATIASIAKKPAKKLTREQRIQLKIELLSSDSDGSMGGPIDDDAPAGTETGDAAGLDVGFHVAPAALLAGGEEEEKDL